MVVRTSTRSVIVSRGTNPSVEPANRLANIRTGGNSRVGTGDGLGSNYGSSTAEEAKADEEEEECVGTGEEHVENFGEEGGVGLLEGVGPVC